MARSNVHKQLLISFSGLDGCGKSTQIENLRRSLSDRGLTVKVLAFWDDVVVLSCFREAFVHKVYRSEQGIGSPDRPVQRRDKNVRKWYLNVVRHGLYVLDALQSHICDCHCSPLGTPMSSLWIDTSTTNSRTCRSLEP